MGVLRQLRNHLYDIGIARVGGGEGPACVKSGLTTSTRRASILVPAGQVNVLRNKVRFILAVLSEELVVHNRKKARRGAP